MANDRIMVLFHFLDYDYFKACEYTAIVAAIGKPNKDGCFDVDSWDGISYKYRKEAPELVKNVLKDFTDVKGVVIDPGLVHSVSCKKISSIIKLIPYDPDVHGEYINELIGYFE